MRAAEGRGRREGGRTVVALLIVVGLIVAVLAGGDHLLRSHVESRFADELAQHLDAENTEVSIDGLVFTPQLLSGQVGSAGVSATSAQLEAFTIHDIDAELTDVSLDAPYHVGHLDLQAVIPESTLQALLAEAGVPEAITVEVTDGDLLAQGSLLGMPVQIALDPQARGRSIDVTVDAAQFGDTRLDIQDLPDAVAEWLTDLEVELTDLPQGLLLEHLEVRSGDVAVHLEGHDLALSDL